MTLEELNGLDRKSFVEALGWIFEDSPWVVERVWKRRPFESAPALHQAMIREVKMASPAEQLALLRAHPDLGTRARLSMASASEQTGAGLDQLTPEEFDLFTSLNNSYKEKFGFPFLYAVKGSNKRDILAALSVRMNAEFEDEYAVALGQVDRIAGFRLNDILAEES